MKKQTKNVPYPELQVGNIALFYGARFEIMSTRLIDNAIFRRNDSEPDNGPVMVAIGKWIDGEIVNGYFGPNKDWTFQGNKLATATIEV